jgi:hypothetical protein
MTRTYFMMRWGMFGLAFLLPIVLLIGGHIGSSGPQPSSISGYYHTSMRNFLVGTLVTMGTFLVLYRIFSRLEDWLLNIAGVATILVAFLPTSRDQGATDGPSAFAFPVGHEVLALIAFAGIGLVAIFFGGDTVFLLPRRQQAVFRWTYRILGLAMIVLPLSIVLFARPNQEWQFIAEWVTLWVFAGYWLTKTLEFRQTNAETAGLQGTLGAPKLTSVAVGDASKTEALST